MNRVHKLDYRVVLDFLETIPCSRSLTVAILYRYSEFDQIIGLSFSPHHYNDVESARWSLQATELLRKHEDLPTSIDRTHVAIEAFNACEGVCAETNERLATDRCQYSSMLFNMARKIQDVLSDFNANEFVDSSGWGPGSTLAIKRRDATPSNKFRQKHELTQPLFDLIKPWFGAAYPKWSLKPRIVRENKVITVPKNAKTDRVIAVEPSMNLFFQKGVGSMIRRRLKRFGVDLNDQTRNQDLARIGSSTTVLATIDFSAASDTISYRLIMDVLPFRWFDILDRLRSASGYIEDSRIDYEKFSSMGNGFTFELESLIFWAAAYVTVPDDHPEKKNINVFGDDVIIPSDCVPLFSSFCKFIGFSVNSKKSFEDSYYRESCGKHYWDGIDITPIYLRRSLLGDEVMRFHNRVVELSRRSIGGGFRDKRFSHLISILADASPIKERIPAGYGDLGLISEFDQASPTFCRNLQRGYFAKAYIPVACKRIEDDESFFLSKLYHLWKSENGDRSNLVSDGNHVSLPSRPKYKRKRLYFEDWPCMGPLL